MKWSATCIKNGFSPLLLTVFFVGIVFSINITFFPLFPLGIHAWAQSDYYAIAQKFYMETWNLFAPETWIYNKQLFVDFNALANDTIIGGNIAIHPYIVGMIMRLFGTDSPIIYRVYCFLWILPLFYFFLKTCNVIGVNKGVQLFVGSTIAFSPVFIFYSVNFMNCVPCLAQMVIGVYFYIKFLYSNDKKDWRWAVVILGVLPLIRTTFLIPFVAILCNEGLKWICRKITFRDMLNRLLIAIPFLLFFIIWLFWSKYMTEKHGSIFLSSLRPVESIEEIQSIFKKTLIQWKQHYMVHYHFWILLIFLGVGLLINRKKIFRFDVSFVFIMIIGYILFAIVMMSQFVHHDYYYLDTFFYPLVLLPIVIFGNLFQDFKGQWAFVLLGFFSAYKSYSIARDYTDFRYNTEYWDPNFQNNFAYIGIDKFIDKNEKYKGVKWVMLSQSAPNRNFTFIKHNGLCGFNMYDNSLKEIDFKKYPYFLITKSEVSEYYDLIIQKLKPIDIYGEVLFLELNTDEPLEMDMFLNYTK